MLKYGDLHIHSTHSDGIWSVKEILKKANELNFSYIAISDHDTISGISEAIEESSNYNIKVIPALEINTTVREIHILGYFIDHNNKELLKKLNSQKSARYSRAEKILKKLSIEGINISIEEIIKETNDINIGRPHIARVLMKKGVVTNIKDAFNRYIGDNCSCYVKREDAMDPLEAIDIIHKANGCAVIAHPFLSVPDDEELLYYIKNGIDGIEVFHSSQIEPKVQEKYIKIANNHDLVITGGSDCHGGDNSSIGKIKLEENYINILYNKFGGKND